MIKILLLTVSLLLQGFAAHGLDRECAARLLALQANPVPLAPQDIHHRLSGLSSGPTIVLLHGLGSSMATFDPVIPALSESHRVLVLDQRGHGRTGFNSTNFSPEIMARDLAGLLDHLGIEKAFVLGHSLGGKTAMAFAGLFPQRTLGLIVEDMEVQPRPKQDARVYLDNAELTRDAPIEFASMDAALAYLQPLLGADAEAFAKRSDALPDGGIRLWLNPRVHFLNRLQGNLADMRPLLKRYLGPKLFLKAESGSDFSDAGLLILRLELPEALLFTIAGSRHNIHGSSTGEFLDTVLRFLRATSN